jgi:ATP-dependent Lon protease
MPNNDLENIELISIDGNIEINNESDEDMPMEISILPIRNIVLFPGMVIPITVGRQRSVRLVKKAYKNSKTIGVVTQAQPTKEDPMPDDLFRYGTYANILKMIVLPDGNVTIIVQGRRSFHIENFTQEKPYFQAKVSYKNDNFPDKPSKSQKALIASLRESASKILYLNPEIPREAQIAIDNIESDNFLINFLSANVNADINEKQALLEQENTLVQAEILLALMLKEVEYLGIKRDIQSKASSDIDQQQRDYYIRQQIKVLQEELGIDSPEVELDRIRAKGNNKKWSKEVSEHFGKELQKIQRINSQSPDYGVLLNYLELMTDLPWNEFSKDNFDLKKGKKVLDGDHFGMDDIKERILEFLAVLKMRGDMKSPILCLVGPPGVGKTSLGKSIAKSLGRKYVRMALGGIHDEAEIRGHRKTYIGAMPGKIIQNLKKVQTSNPVFVLDEIDKIGSDFKGDPSSALLEVLDPEQNNSFTDNYLEIEYDLSKVLFIATANSLDTIQPALRDRLEIIELGGYSTEEKVEIAKKHLIPKSKKDIGIEKRKITLTDAAIQKVIESYTRESGVRKLEQEIAKLMRKIAKSIAMNEEHPTVVKPENVLQLLGNERFEREAYDRLETAGLAIGLAWTSVGGEILTIESLLMKGKGNLTLSGQLGDVMKESALAALSYLRANADKLNIDNRMFEQFNLHIHVPAGAIPKDGPSAGITMLTSMTSAFTQRKIKPFLAMTGEITLSGKVLPVGGIKEKVLAAKRAGIKEIVMSIKNKKDVEEIKADYIKGLQFYYVESAQEVLDIALLQEKVKQPMTFNLEG